MTDQYLRYLTVLEHCLVVLMILTPILGNVVSRILVASGAPDAARKLDARIPYALNAMTEADKLAKGALVLVKPADAVVVVEEPKDPDPPNDTPKGMGPALLALSFCLALMACSNALQSAAQVANYTAQAETEVAPLLESRCVEPAKKLLTILDDTKRVAAAQALDAVCRPMVDAYDAVRVARIGLVADIARAQSGGEITVEELVAMIDEAMTELTKLSKLIAADSSMRTNPAAQMGAK